MCVMWSISDIHKHTIICMIVIPTGGCSERLTTPPPPPASLAFVKEDNADDQGDEHDIRQFVPPTKTNRGIQLEA